MKHRTFLPADILLPESGLEDWSIIACDQFSSEQDYWNRVRERTAGKASAFHMVVPEAFLEGVSIEEAAAEKNRVMADYLARGIFRAVENAFVYVEREVTGGLVRRGIVGKMDLDAYEYTEGTSAPIRASEKTVVERLPARITVREHAPLELPHVLILIDDPGKTVVEPLTAKKEKLRQLYDFQLMEGGGRIRGWEVAGAEAEPVLQGMDALCDRPVQIVIGDGNHSLAAAKACWEEIKKGLSEKERENHPARYALVELNNVYDSGIVFEAIHRVVFDVQPEKLLCALKEKFGAGGQWTLECVYGGKKDAVSIPANSLGGMIHTLQQFIEAYIGEHGGSVDYIHDDEAVLKLTEREGSIGFFIPKMDKSDLFKTVIADGVFPKKSFSIGHARDKRYYLECRKIIKE